MRGAVAMAFVLALVPVVADAAAGGADDAPEDRTVTPKSPPHHTESGFFNPGYAPPEFSPLTVGLPFMLRRVVGSLVPRAARAPLRVIWDRGSDTDASRSPATLTWVGHSTLLVSLAGVTFLTDPIWSNTASPFPFGPRRYVEPPMSLEELPHVDFVVVSHNHYDHMDINSLKALSRAGSRIFVPLANAHILKAAGIEAVAELDWWDSATVGNVTVHCVPARHWSRRTVLDRNRSLWSGWVVSGAGKRFYFAGDTAAFAGFAEIGRRLGPFDMAALPIGAYSPPEMMAASHLTPEEAVDAAVALRTRRSVAVHFGTFDLSDEPLDEPPRRFLAASVAAARGSQRDWVLAIGETRSW